ncbi:hypothetical protein PI23P_05942 [Polaribacter irgensii 23-P]|uniref:Uncharacterized protein n=1 Tax=Polaribacter irgensii 23-P TaxID=313594 RepID=A4BYH5_9FLAO|nr:hypothetical protein PI23P_05942 [Polaribacter irgensii 23-P]
MWTFYSVIIYYPHYLTTAANQRHSLEINRDYEAPRRIVRKNYQLDPTKPFELFSLKIFNSQSKLEITLDFVVAACPWERAKNLLYNL